MHYTDLGLNIPESIDTLLLQQQRLKAGKRYVQMFPVNSDELSLPEGMSRLITDRGVFHYNPAKISARQIWLLSQNERENEFLELGPYNKADVFEKIQAGEVFLTIMEVTPEGVEVRAAAGCTSTVAEQLDFFEQTKEPKNTVTCSIPERVLRTLLKNEGVR